MIQFMELLIRLGKKSEYEMLWHILFESFHPQTE